MNVHETIDLDLVVADALTAPAFLPLGELVARGQVLESQSSLALDGVPDVQAQVALAPVGSVAGSVPPTLLAQGPVFAVPTTARDSLRPLTPEFLGQGGVLGLVLTAGTIPAGTHLRGKLSRVYGAI